MGFGVITNAQQKNNTQKKQEKASWLFVLNSEKGIAVACSNDASKKCLQLTGVQKTVAAFTDRPNRKYGSIPTEKLIKAWKKLFKNDPPNAAISHPDLKKRDVNDVHVVTIEKVKLDKNNGITMELSYMGDDPIELNKTHNNISIFIDAAHPRPTACCIIMPLLPCCHLWD